jgi:hypothetical protein
MKLTGGQIVVETLVREGVLQKIEHKRDAGSPAVDWWDVPVPTHLAEQRGRYERERAEER